MVCGSVSFCVALCQFGDGGWRKNGSTAAVVVAELLGSFVGHGDTVTYREKDEEDGLRRTKGRSCLSVVT